jgi:AraC-like DNA-binding protein/mannose-6-phosphate isomerase-like protein (cupin superfamily)
MQDRFVQIEVPMGVSALSSAASGYRRTLPFEPDIEGVPRAVVTRSCDYAPGLNTDMHVHSRSQLIFAIVGTMTVSTTTGVWAVPANRAVWIPAGVEHSVKSNDRLSMRSMFIDPKRCAKLSDCCMVVINPLLRELILHANQLPPLYPLDGPEDRFMSVLLEQIEAAPSAPLYLPMPTDRRLRRVAMALLENPRDSKSVHEWGKQVGASARTLSRLFPVETGMSFTRWQQSARILEALRRLSVGESVVNVAQQVGYESPSAFVLMFKKTLGKTPKQYLKTLSGES